MTARQDAKYVGFERSELHIDRSILGELSIIVTRQYRGGKRANEPATFYSGGLWAGGEECYDLRWDRLLARSAATSSEVLK